ncbi:MAG: hypothetical protein A2402_01645 [Candidatus Staskawiczbacteria bacterium RIFOXYC1_FULL_37_43]|nr:MAG: hypothetical protein A2813_01830 [Candidatus Staskawiczbacteria bacterium RIFCSPHIGHO2_01_FULL_37_17]OGZ72148.1 MAG: hypothetical protein A2891_01995 [Candidatus Staskawiczbacteria bacterium RIFCSPLOWO2_01_FULL_37_19]OGZ75483.1 MAG: hypothetical protein A2205_01750 [Candidatus Staskawiczbacteria bacterium RIFOXYA1_FULL_37_15]OGZ77745.1 MAG: hypothetical protein A2280_03220 [Candidatus Staskawiczbacteria bacterium RIFOXYA12_FULL_37_10]OGZ80471.1 MAG: hypothetical protein A2353_03015 [Can
MSRTIAITLIAITILISLALGTGIGIFYQMQKTAPQLVVAEKNAVAVKGLSSALVLSAVAYGQVSAIDGRKITLTYKGETMQIEIAKDALIYYLPTTGGSLKLTEANVQKAKISDIKKGDLLNITITVSSDGVLTGNNVSIVSSAAEIK